MFRSLKSQGKITEKELKYFIYEYQNATNLGKIYLLLKIHKILHWFKKIFVVVIWGNINFLYKFDMLIMNISVMSLHHVRIFFYERSKYLLFSLKFLKSRVNKVYYSWNKDWEALKIAKMPPKQTISTSLGYGRSSRSLYLLTFGVGM